MFQSTHPHGVRHQPFSSFRTKRVSIHAPTRGATDNGSPRGHTTALFQSTHPHGVRPTKAALRAMPVAFQSTHPHGVRLSHIQQYVARVRVSIHAPTRGATTYIANGEHEEKFQSTHPHGVRRVANIREVATGVFQSTHPHGVRPYSRNSRISSFCFNPRTHTGCDGLP